MTRSTLQIDESNGHVGDGLKEIRGPEEINSMEVSIRTREGVGREIFEEQSTRVSY